MIELSTMCAVDSSLLSANVAHIRISISHPVLFFLMLWKSYQAVIGGLVHMWLMYFALHELVSKPVVYTDIKHPQDESQLMLSEIKHTSTV